MELTNTPRRALKDGQANEDDLKLLAQFRTTFDLPFAEVLRDIQGATGLSPTARAAKTTESIVAKLQREKISLSTIQDLAGCRLIVEDIAAQEKTMQMLISAFPDAKVVDRRLRPSHGYRAVHLIVRRSGRRVEIQIRTRLQQLWAEFSEKSADQIDARAKYGSAPAWLQSHLMKMSELIQQVESAETQMLGLKASVTQPISQLDDITATLRSLVETLPPMFENEFQLIMAEWHHRRSRHDVSD